MYRSCDIQEPSSHKIFLKANVILTEDKEGMASMIILHRQSSERLAGFGGSVGERRHNACRLNIVSFRTQRFYIGKFRQGRIGKRVELHLKLVQGMSGNMKSHYFLFNI